jgi:RNA polymerase sporulation-specific sigma factor
MLTLILSFIFHIYHLILGVSTPNKFPPPLSIEEEKKHFKLAKSGCEDSRQKLILHNLRLVSHIVRKYYSNAPDSEDLVSIGTIGLVKAVDTYKIESGIRFATYAARCIQNEILMNFRSAKKRLNDVSLAETIDVDRDGNPLTYMDIISTNEDLGDELDKKTQIERAMRLIQSTLNSREKQIIAMRYGLYGINKTYTQKEIAQKLNISRSYVSRIEKSALDKLREKLL